MKHESKKNSTNTITRTWKVHAPSRSVFLSFSHKYAQIKIIIMRRTRHSNQRITFRRRDIRFREQDHPSLNTRKSIVYHPSFSSSLFNHRGQNSLVFQNPINSSDNFLHSFVRDMHQRKRSLHTIESLV